MSASSFARVRELVERAHLLGHSDRERLLERECGADEGLRREVEELLRAATESPDFLAPLEPGRMLSALPAALGEPGEGAQIAGFRLVRRIAEGGMGTVWEAEQDEPRRRVALKTVRPGLDPRESLRRFRHEAEILARLRHPNIAQIHASGIEAGRDGQAGLPWYAMEYVESARTVIEHARALALEDRLRLFVVLCRAVQHGHERGVIHRDLKPGNVLVDEQGTLKVIDFGVARIAADPARPASFETDAGRVLGTLPYMSPEQVSGGSDGLDTRSDVYALGVILYQLLTNELPHDLSRASLAEAARLLQERVPERPSARVRGLSSDLDVITLKALEKERDRRYGSAAAMADDVERWLRGEPVSARPPSMAYQLRVFARRHGVVVGALLLVFTVLVVATAVSLGYAWRATRAEGISRESETAAIRQKEAYRFREYTANIAAAHGALLTLDVVDARARLDLCPPDLRGFEWWHLRRRLDRSSSTSAIEGDGVQRIVWHPSCEILYVATREGRIEARDAATRDIVALLSAPGTIVFDLAIDPAGSRLAAASTDGRLRLWDTVTSQELPGWKAHDGPMTCCAFGADGSTIVTGGIDGRTRVWDARSGALLHELGSPGTWVSDLAVHPRGDLLATGFTNGAVHLWKTATEELVQVLAGPKLQLSQLCFSADGEWLAAAGHDHTVRLWRMPDARDSRILRGHTGIVLGLAFDPAGRRLATCGWDRTLRMWDVESGATQSVLLGHTANVNCLAFSPDGRSLASGDATCRLKLWSGTPDNLRTIRVRGKWSWTLRFLPGSSTLFAVHGGYADFYDARTGEEVASFPSEQREWSVGDVSPDGRTLALVHSTRFVDLIAVQDGSRIARWPLPEMISARLRWSPRGDRLALTSTEGRLILLSPEGDTLCSRNDSRAALAGLDWSPDGSMIVTGGLDGDLRLHEGDTVTPRCGPEHAGAGIRCLSWSGDGRWIALGLQDGRVRLWGTRERRFALDLLGHRATVLGVAFSPDGTRLATASEDRTVKLWDLPEGREVATFGEHGYKVEAVAFSPDGSILASGSADSTLRLWDAGDALDHRLEILRSDHHLRSAVLSALSDQADLSGDDREILVRRAAAIPDDPDHVAREAWAIARASDSGMQAYEIARAMAAEALERRPRDGLALRALGAAELRLGRAQAALEVLEVCTRACPDDRSARALRLLALARLDRSDEAVPEFEELRRIDLHRPGSFDPVLDGLLKELAPLVERPR